MFSRICKVVYTYSWGAHPEVEDHCDGGEAVSLTNLSLFKHRKIPAIHFC
jgi:hypothetical protein